jgi:hypothetical protein
MVLAYDQTLECAELAQTEAKITLMEDGVLHRHHTLLLQRIIPTVSRMQSFEILKGGSQIQYGPYTTGGAKHGFYKFQDVFQAVLLPA